MKTKIYNTRDGKKIGFPDLNNVTCLVDCYKAPKLEETGTCDYWVTCNNKKHPIERQVFIELLERFEKSITLKDIKGNEFKLNRNESGGAFINRTKEPEEYSIYTKKHTYHVNKINFDKFSNWDNKGKC